MKTAGVPYENDGGARKQLLQARQRSFEDLLEDVQNPAVSKGFWWKTESISEALSWNPYSVSK